MQTMNSKETGISRLLARGPVVFLLLWSFAVAVYLPSAKAGWVIDAVGYVSNMKIHGFWDYINSTWSQTKSFYQLYNLQFVVFYKLFGVNPLGWSFMFITTHAINSFLLFLICKKVLTDSGFEHAAVVSIAGAVLFTGCPHIGEVLVWKACYHYLMGFLFILLIMRWTITYQHNQQKKYLFYCAGVFILAVFGVEIWYLIPGFVLTIAFYYRFGLQYDKGIFRKTLLYIFLPQVVLFIIYFIAFYFTYKSISPHKSDALTQPMIEYLSKPAKILFHVVLLGRYFPMHIKDKAYALCESAPVLIVLYSCIAMVFLYLLLRLSKIKNSNKAIFLMFAWMVMILFFMMPLSFPASALLVFYDRYTYFINGFIYTLLAMLLSRLRYLAIGLFVVYLGANLFYSYTLNKYWKQSAYVTNRLLTGLPDAGTKKIMLLNLPENMYGVPMIGADPGGEFKAMRNLLVDTTVKNTIYDVMSYNILTMQDGAHVKVINDSTVIVTLNQWGTWWWYGGHGGVSYENSDYKVDLKDPGHWYELTLKHPADNFLLLYEIDGAWKKVDMSKRDVDQN